MNHRIWRAALLVLVAGCSNEISGPSPQLSDTNPLTPSFVCNEQIETWVRVQGSDFSPLVIDALNDPSAENPTVTLTRTQSIEGGAAEEQTLVLDNGETTQVRWFNNEELQVLLGPETGLSPGVWNVSVQNSNGNAAESEDSLGVLPRPSISALEPSYTCLAQGGRELVVVGDHFLIQGETPATVEIGDKTYTPSAADECRDLHPVFGGAQVCQRLTITLAEADFEPGLHDVRVQNAAPAACESVVADDESRLTVVPEPTLEAVVEDLTCVAQGERSFVAQGLNFIQAEDAPSVEINGQVYTTTTSGCEEVTTFGGSFQRCTEAAFAIPAADLPAGAFDVVLTNPTPAGCSTTEPVQLTVVAPPSIASVEPGVLCSEQLENTITITGEGFVTYDGTAPQVRIAGETFDSTASDCSTISTVVNGSAETCTTLSVVVPAEALEPGALDVVVINPDPAGCESESEVEVNFIAPPSVTEVVRDFICVETTAAVFRVVGEGFLVFEGDAPTVTVDGVAAANIDAQNCVAIEGVADAELCDTLVLDLALGAVEPGVHDVVVTNPAPAACVSTEPATIEAYPAPTVTAVTPELFCTDTGATTLTVTGTNFYVVEGENPAVSVGATLIPATATAATCTDTNRPGLQACTELTVDVPQGFATPSGVTEISVYNPAPVACGASISQETLVAGPPNVDSLMPMAVCAGEQFDGMVTAQGSAFLIIDGNSPSVTIEGQSVASTPSDCTPVDHPSLSISTCNELAFVVPLAFRSSDVDISISNPAPSDCGQSDVTLVLAPTPEIASVTPLRLCDAGGTIQIDGQNFAADMQVTLGAEMATTVTVNATGTSATAVFDQTAEGTYNLTVVNPATSCSATHNEDVRVVTGPRAFYVDPPVLYDGISTQVTIYLTGLFGGTLTGAALVDSQGTEIPLTGLTFDPQRPNIAQAVVPADTLPEMVTSETYGVILTDDVSCSETSPGLVTITDELTVAVEAIDPPFGWTSANTDVTITSPETPAAGLTNFAATPRVYLNPSNAQAGDIATEVRAVQYLSPTELNGIVPQGLPVATYDVIVINPDGSVGLLAGGFDVTTEPPPTVSTVSPGSWETNETNWLFAVEGENFRTPTLELTCLSGNTALITVDAFTATAINASVDTGTLTHLDVCVIRVTNTDDGTYVDYAPITVTNPAGNFVSFENGTTMQTARRAPALGAAPVTASARYIYAVGGDDGTSGGALTSVEASGLDRFGRPGDWFELGQALGSARTLSQVARVGDFLYLVAGHDGTTATGSVLRAHVLNPLDTTEISNVEFDIRENLMGGMAPGVYYYRVAPVMPATDPANPSGEMLASERQPVRIPFQGIDLLIAWTPYPGASEYRVYRSPAPDAPAGEEELLVTLPATSTSYIDNYSQATTPESPLPLGSLGQWHDAGVSLGTARYSHGLTVAVDPADANLRHIYAVGGTDGAGAQLSSVERVSVTINGPKDQVVATGQVTAVLGTARAELTALTANTEVASNITSSANYVFALGGRTGTNSFSRATEWAEVQAGGDLAFFTGTTQTQRSRSGYAAALANNNFVTACGQNGSPSNSADKMPISETSPPNTDNPSALGSTGNLANRYLPGAVSFGGVLYVAGGETASPASNTVDHSTLGGTP